MSSALHTRTQRFALLLILLLASQLAVAGQLCQTVMAPGMAGDRVPRAVCGPAAHEGRDAQPCCDDTSIPRPNCPLALAEATQALLASLVNAQVGGAAPPPSVLAVLPVSDDTTGHVAAFPASSAGRVLPVYILYLRFLS